MRAKKKSQKTLFYVISLLIPFGFLVLIEVALRLVGFGHSTPLFIQNPAHPSYLLARPDVMKRYFPFTENPPNVTMEADFFVAEKPANGLRIFIQGGSTAAGFPYGLGASMSGLLEQRLRQSLESYQVEVINTAMSAVNSHQLLDLADEIIAQDPDAVMIYAGHNEYLGILGASSNFTTSNSYWLTRIKISLKDFRLFQLLQYLYVSVQDNTAQMPLDSASQSRSTMMAQVAVDQSIPYMSDTYDAGIEQFTKNISKLLGKYKDAGVPVFIASIASNQKHQAPFQSLAPEPEYQNQINNLIEQIDGNFSTQNQQRLLSMSKQLKASQSAILHFEFAHYCLLANMNNIALRHFNLAIDHDLLKFRAPTKINQQIKELASQHSAYFVDVLSAFQQRSPKGIIGNELMLEHLHPNLQGYFVISQAFYETIARHHKSLFADFKEIKAQKAWQERLVLPSEEYLGFAMIQKLKAAYPFVDNPTPINLPEPQDQAQRLGLQHFNQQINWLSMMQANLEYYRLVNDQKLALKTLQILADALPNNGLYNAQAADDLYRLREYALALHYYKRALLAGAIDAQITKRVNFLESKLQAH